MSKLFSNRSSGSLSSSVPLEGDFGDKADEHARLVKGKDEIRIDHDTDVDVRGVQVAVSGIKRRVTAYGATLLTLAAVVNAHSGWNVLRESLLAGTLILAWDIKLQTTLWWSATVLALAGLWSNALWRTLLLVGALVAKLVLGDQVSMPVWAYVTLGYAVTQIPYYFPGRMQPPTGCVFVSGADSGMGFNVAVRLAQRGYQVFAGCYAADSEEKLLAELPKAFQQRLLVVDKFDVTNDRSVARAESLVRAYIEKGEWKGKKGQLVKATAKAKGLVGVINCAGVGHSGPAEYFPLETYKKQFEVNFFGYVRVAQAFLPLMREAASKPDGRRGRLVFFGTGGGVKSPVPPLLSAYMASKFAVEAFASSLRCELQLTKSNIDVTMVNPGIIKPTNLQAGGIALTQKMWSDCEAKNGSAIAQDTYGKFLDKFMNYQVNEPGTHVSVVADKVEVLMTAPRAKYSVMVGPDSKAAPIVGTMPVAIRDWVMKKNIWGEVGDW